jgi:AcrR family transcriptional regulator
MKTQSKKPNLKQAQAEERRLQILDTALTVFAEKGFAGASIKDIAQAAGISQGLMYHYFASKEELLDATVEYHSFLPQLRQILASDSERPFDEVYLTISNQFLNTLDDKAKLVRILIQEIGLSPTVKNTWAKMCHEGMSLLQKYIDSQIARGYLRPHRSEVTARSLFSMMFMFHFTWDAFASSSISREEFIKEVLNNLLQGIGNK